jgi:hypothetical protein
LRSGVRLSALGVQEPSLGIRLRAKKKNEGSTTHDIIIINFNFFYRMQDEHQFKTLLRLLSLILSKLIIKISYEL